MVYQAGGPVHLLAAVEGLRTRVVGELAGRIPAELRDLRGSHARILDLLEPGGSRPSNLVAGAWITKQAVGKRIRELEARGWVAVEPDPVDGRALVVRRTPAGDRAHATVLAAVEATEARIAAVVGHQRWLEFRAVLDELAAPPTAEGGTAARGADD